MRYKDKKREILEESQVKHRKKKKFNKKDANFVVKATCKDKKVREYNKFFSTPLRYYFVKEEDADKFIAKEERSMNREFFKYEKEEIKK